MFGKLIRNSHGGSLILAMVSGVALIAAGIYMTQTRREQDKMRLSLLAKHEKNSFVREITESLSDHEACFLTFQSAGTLSQGKELNTIYGANGFLMYGIGSGRQNETIKKLELKSYQSASGFRYNAAQLHVTLDTKPLPGQELYGARQLIYQVPLFLITKDDEVVTCMSDPSKVVRDAYQSACQEFGGIFDELAGRCEGIHGSNGVVLKYVRQYLCSQTGAGCEHPHAGYVCQGVDIRGVNWNNFVITGFTAQGQPECACMPATCPDPALFCDGVDTGTNHCNLNCPVGTKSCPNVWDVGGWGACSSVCQGGTQTRPVVCKDYLGAVIPDSNCTPPKPTDIQSCNNGIPCAYSWITGAYGACSSTCGPGNETRTVFCQDDLGNTVADSNCTDPKPSETRACNGTDCGYAWLTGNWGSCSVSCGTGTKLRSVDCIDNSSNAVVADSNCAGTKPNNSTSCPGNDCGYQWIFAAGTCDQVCGPGTQTNTVYCQDNATNSQVAESNCTDPKPPVTQSCNGTDCGYSWIENGWGACTGNCGSGVQTQTISCRRNSDSVTVANTFCSPPTPPTSQACPGNCNYAWEPGAWSTCDESCGPGNSTRAVDCKEQSTNQVVASSMCTGSMPSTSQACNLGACPCKFRPTWGTGLDQCTTTADVTINEGEEATITGGQSFVWWDPTKFSKINETNGSAVYKCINGVPQIIGTPTCNANCAVRTIDFYFPPTQQQKCRMTNQPTDISATYETGEPIVGLARVQHGQTRRFNAPNSSWADVTCNNGNATWSFYCIPVGPGGEN